MQKTPYPYCRHGAYVGGCGADYMCGMCEDGEPDPTPKQLAARIDRLKVDRADLFFKIADVVATCELNHRAEVIVVLAKELLAPMDAKIRQAVSEHEEASGWADHDDDDRWTWNRLAARQKEWNRLDGIDQLWSLPSQILDGP